MRRICIIILIFFPFVCFAQGQITRPVKKQQQTEVNNTKDQETPKKKTQSAPKTSKSEPQKPTQGFINGHEWVDLGLPSGTKWATCNIGAWTPTSRGGYFAWGYAEYSNKNGLWNNSVEYLRSMRIINSNNVLTKTHDAASVNWGGTWRMPTKVEFEELKSECTWTWIDYGEHKGYKVIGPNGEYIYFPAAGRSDIETKSSGYYWSATKEENSVFILLFSDSGIQVCRQYMKMNISVRPVTD